MFDLIKNLFHKEDVTEPVPVTKETLTAEKALERSNVEGAKLTDYGVNSVLRIVESETKRGNLTAMMMLGGSFGEVNIPQTHVQQVLKSLEKLGYSTRYVATARYHYSTHYGMLYIRWDGQKYEEVQEGKDSVKKPVKNKKVK